MLSVGDLLKIFELIGLAGVQTDTMNPEGDIMSITYPLEITIPAGQSLTFSLPLQRQWLCILDWCDIDMSGIGYVTVTYKRDGIQWWSFSRPIKTVPIDVGATQSVDLTITNSDTVDHEVSVLWHYVLARADKYVSFVTAVGGFIDRIIREVAVRGIQMSEK